MKKINIVLLFLSMFFYSGIYAKGFSSCDESLVYDYKIQDAINRHEFLQGVEFFCSTGVNHILRRAKNIIKDDASQFYSLQIATLDQCLQFTVLELISTLSPVIEKNAIYFLLESEAWLHIDLAYGQQALFVKMGSKKVSVVMDDTHEVGNHVNGDQLLPEYEVDLQGFMNLSSISQNLDTLLCTNGPRP